MIEKKIKTILKIKSSSIALDYIKKKNMSKKIFNKLFDKDLEKITNEINDIIK